MLPSVRPLTLRRSAVLRNAGRFSWGTFTSPAYMNSKIDCKWLNGTSFKMIMGCFEGLFYQYKFIIATCIISLYLQHQLRYHTHFQQSLEVWTACRQDHLVGLASLSIACEGDISEAALCPQVLEAGDNVRLEVVPSQAKLLLIRHFVASLY